MNSETDKPVQLEKTTSITLYNKIQAIGLFLIGIGFCSIAFLSPKIFSVESNNNYEIEKDMNGYEIQMIKPGVYDKNAFILLNKDTGKITEYTQDGMGWTEHSIIQGDLK